MRPVTVFSFANCAEAHLDLLKEESRELVKAFGCLHDKQALEVYREESATVNEIVDIFHRFRQRISIFHYAGHAGGERLLLEGGDAQASGLASLFEQEKDNLALVFLNGCSTLGQVKELMKLGIKAVIATSTPIEDTKAKEFSTWFYQALSMRQTIGQAFDFAVSALKTKYKDINLLEDPVTFRTIEFKEVNEQEETNGLPWAMYVNEDHPQALEWKVPNTPKPQDSFVRASNFQSNDYLYSILDAMLEFNPEIEKSLTNAHEEELDEREYLDLIIKNFPWTIGAQLQKLVAYSDKMANPGKPRLEQIASTYLITSQLMLFFIISQIWEKCQTEEAMKNPDILSILNIDRASYVAFDYLAHMKSIRGFLKDEPLFIPEMEDFCNMLEDHKSELYKSYLFLESIKDRLHDKSIDEYEAAGLSEEAEFHLAMLLSQIAFLVNYQMIAVRDIKIVNHRHKAIEYQHKLGELNAYAESRLGLHRTPKKMNNYTHCNSILLVKDPNGMEEFLSLSPFIIDKNTFLDSNQLALNIYIFAYRDNHSGEYIYHGVNTALFNDEQRHASHIHTGYKEVKQIKKGIKFRNRGLVGIKKTKENLPYFLLKEQFEVLQNTFRRGGAYPRF